MKHILFLILSILSLSIASCKKEKNTYDVECIAKHWWTQENEWGIGMGSGYYGFTLNDENYNDIWDKSGTVQDETLTFNTTAKSGDYIFVYIATYDTWDYCTAEVKVNGNSVIYISENNQFLDESTSYDFRTINGKEYIVKEIKLP
jgi:hypothetical protein